MPNANQSLVRVALVVRPAEGGILSHIRTQLSAIDRAEFRPIIVAPIEFLDRLHAHDEQIPCEISAHTNPIDDLSLIRKLSRDLKEKCDLIHAHGIRGALIGVLSADRIGVPSIFTAHNQLSVPHAFTRLALRVIAGKCSAIIAVSNAVKQYLIAGGFPDSKINVIPNGIQVEQFTIQHDDAETRNLFGLNPQSRIILGLGRLSPEKGFDLLIEAFGKLDSYSTNLQLVITGDGPEDIHLRKQAESLILKNPTLNDSSIVFTGRTERTAELIQCAEMVVIPSREEGQGLVALETMASGRVVIATRVGGLKETIQDNINGLLIPPEDPAGISTTIIRVLEDSHLASRLGIAGKNRVESEYTATLMIQRMENLYRICANPNT